MHKEPLVRIVKRTELTKMQGILLRLFAIALAIIAGGIFIAVMGTNPFEAYAAIIRGAFVGSRRNPLSSIQATVIIAVPLIITALALSLAFKMKFWNIGGEGQIIMGGVFATFFALHFENAPHLVLILLMFIGGMIGGGLWGLIPAIFKVRFGTNETLFTLMLNYIALYTVKYLENGPWQRTSGFGSIGQLSKNIRIAEVGGVHIGWIIAIVLVILVYFYLNHSKQGYEITVVGESRATARYAGMGVSKIVTRTMFLSGALCGLVGVIQICGIDYTLSTGITGGVGFTGITVAWLSQLNPFVISLVSSLFAILEKGSGVMQSDIGLSLYAADVLQGIILFFVLGCEFFIRYSLSFRKGGRKK